MKTPVRLLHLEDDATDAELIRAELRQEELPCEWRRVASRAAYAAALDEGGFDLILADYNLPGFDGLSALALARARRPEVPFLFVSGFLGEEVGLDSLKNGATDYVFKHHLARLGPAVRRALQEARAQRERRQAEAAWQERDAILESFYNAAPFMMGVVELLPDDLLILSANAASAKFLGVTPEAMRWRRLSEFAIPAEAIRRSMNALRQSLRLARPVELEEEFPRNGRPCRLAITVSPLPAAPAQSAQRSRFCYVTEDVTGKRELEQQLFRAQRLESVGTLASGLAHDLNNVLAPILLALRVFRPKLTDADDRELLATLEASTHRGADIIRQVLTFARGAPGTRQPLRLQPLVSDVAGMLRDTFPRTVTLETQVPDDLREVVGDATQIYQVLMNLCVNARDAMPAGGRLVIAAENAFLDDRAPLPPGGQAGLQVVLTVRDTGAGIAPEILDTIFDPFFTTKEIGEGTGLGLSTLLTIVKSHGGFVTVTSEPGRGTEFKVHLPAVAASDRPATPAAAGAPERGHGEVILLVDDEPAIRRAGRAALAAHGYRVIAAANGVEALETFHQYPDQIRLVVADMVMPVLDGSALLETLQKMHPTVKRIAMSGLLEAARAGPAGVVCLQKPFTAETLLHAVQQALRPPGPPPAALAAAAK